MRGPLLLLLIACLSAVVVGAVFEGMFWLAVVALALALALALRVGALLLSTSHPRTRPAARPAGRAVRGRR